VMATASLDLYAIALGRRLGFHHVVATRAAWSDDRLVFGLDGANLRGADKVVEMEKLLSTIGPARPRIIAYSDHHSDLPLLRFADVGVAVDPTARLVSAIAGLGILIERWDR